MIDLNCDIGEGEPIEQTARMMRAISSANIACGGHAGNETTMRRTTRLAARHGVRVGAHPGTGGEFGRGVERIGGDEFEALLRTQVRRLAWIATGEGQALQHVKLHGGLYHWSETDDSLGERYVTVMRRRWPGVRIYARAGGRIAEKARRYGVEVWGEAFADRDYEDDGSLVPRNEPGALITDPAVVRSRMYHLRCDGTVRSRGGKYLRLPVRTICVHSDTSGAGELLALARQCLAERLG
jgi:UPF0271 protein